MSQNASQVRAANFPMELKSLLQEPDKGKFFEKLLKGISIQQGIFCNINASNLSSSGFGLCLEMKGLQQWVTVMFQNEEIFLRNGSKHQVYSLAGIRKEIEVAASEFKRHIVS